MAKVTYSPYQDFAAQNGYSNGYKVKVDGGTFSSIYSNPTNTVFDDIGDEGAFMTDPKDPTVGYIGMNYDFKNDLGYTPQLPSSLFNEKITPEYSFQADNPAPVVTTPPVTTPTATTQGNVNPYKDISTRALNDVRFDKSLLTNNPYTLNNGKVILNGQKLRDAGFTGEFSDSAAVNEFLASGVFDDNYSGIDNYFTTQEADPSSTYYLQKQARDNATKDATAQKLDYQKRALAINPNYDFSKQTDAQVKIFVDANEAKAKKATEDTTAATQATAAATTYQTLKTQADTLWNSVSSIVLGDATNSIPESGRIRELSNKFDTGLGTDADLAELKTLVGKVTESTRRDGVNSSVKKIGEDGKANIIDYSTDSVVTDGYTVSDPETVAGFGVPDALAIDPDKTVDSIKEATYTDSVIDTSKLDKVNEVDITKIPKAAVVNATAAQIDASNPAYKVTPDKITAGDALKGLIGKEMVNKLTVNDNQLATKATQDLVNNSKTTKWDVDGKQLTSGILSGLLSQNGRYLQDARNRGMRTANSRGLLNSAMAAGIAEEAAIAAAMPIVQQDAKTYAEAAQAYALADNTRLNEGMRLNAGAISSDALTQFNAEKENTAALNNALIANSNIYGKQADLDQRRSENDVANKLTADTNYATLTSNIADKNADRTTTVDVANKKFVNDAEMNFATNQTTAMFNKADAQNKADLAATQLDSENRWKNSELSGKNSMYNAGSYNDALKFDAAQLQEWKSLGINLEFDEKKTVAGWNFEGVLKKYDFTNQQSRDKFLAKVDLKKLFSAQNFELGNAVVSKLMKIASNNNESDKEAMATAIANQFDMDKLVVGKEYDFDMLKYTTNEEVNQKIYDRAAKIYGIDAEIAAKVLTAAQTISGEIMTSGDVTGASKLGGIQSTFQTATNVLSFLRLYGKDQSITGVFVDPGSLPVTESTTPSTTTASTSTTKGVLGQAFKKATPQEVDDWLKSLTPEEAKSLSEKYQKNNGAK